MNAFNGGVSADVFMILKVGMVYFILKIEFVFFTGMGNEFDS